MPIHTDPGTIDSAEAKRLGVEDLRILRTERVPVDGAELAADVVLPPGDGPWPVLISNFSPYHKDALIGAAYFRCHAYFAAHGYASVVADMRGLGGSSGVPWPNIDLREAEDGVALVEWAAAQSWCDGNVGMWGVSYGGVSSFATAAKRPPHLRAIVPIYAAVDPYDEFFYPGGCRNFIQATGVWGPRMIGDLLAPPLHQDPAGRWLEVWRQRLEASEPWILDWHEHQERDASWQARSTTPEEIEAPTFVIGGWRDLFPTGIETFGRLTCPKRLLMGPWPHVEPDRSEIVPTDHLSEMLRWWDQWLKGKDTGVLDQPPVTVYVQGAGHWRSAPAWPIADAEIRTLYLADQELTTAPPASGEIAYTTDPSVGMAAGVWPSTGTMQFGVAADQREDEARSLTFRGPVLESALQIAGSPSATLNLRWDPAEEVNVVVKLSDVAPDGSSALITTGWRRLAPGSGEGGGQDADGFREVAVQLWPACHELSPGHRLSVMVACSDFPRIWPTPTNPTIGLSIGAAAASCVAIPVVSADEVIPDLPAPSPDAGASAEEAASTWRVERDMIGNRVGMTLGEQLRFSTPQGDAHMFRNHEVHASLPLARPDGTSMQTTTQIDCTMPNGAYIEVEVRGWVGQRGVVVHGEVKLDGVPFFSRDWAKTYAP